MNYKSQIYSFTHQYFPSFSFPSSCQYILISFEKYAYTHTQNTLYTDLLFNSPNSHDSELGQFGTRCPKLNWVSHVGGILPAKRTVTCCVLGLALAGNWNEDYYCYMNSNILKRISMNKTVLKVWL